MSKSRLPWFVAEPFFLVDFIGKLTIVCWSIFAELLCRLSCCKPGPRSAPSWGNHYTHGYFPFSCKFRREYCPINTKGVQYSIYGWVWKSLLSLIHTDQFCNLDRKRRKLWMRAVPYGRDQYGNSPTKLTCLRFHSDLMNYVIYTTGISPTKASPVMILRWQKTRFSEYQICCLILISMVVTAIWYINLYSRPIFLYSKFLGSS